MSFLGGLLDDYDETTLLIGAGVATAAVVGTTLAMNSDSKKGFRSVQLDGKGLGANRDTICDYSKPRKQYVLEPHETRPIILAKEGVAASKPVTMVEMFSAAVKKFPNAVALKKEYKNAQGEFEWREWTYTQYFQECKDVAKALVATGLKPHQVINIIGFNSPEWFFADIGAILAGGIAAGIYTTNNPGSCKYITEHSKAEYVFIENKMHLDKFLSFKDELPQLRYLVVWDTEGINLGALAGKQKVLAFRDFVALGKDVPDASLEERWANMRPENVCTLIYTSGTTGNPKAVMASHDNMSFTGRQLLSTCLPSQPAQQRVISYLPLSHLAAQVADIFFPLMSAAEFNTPAMVAIARPDALKGSLPTTLKAVKPTLFFGVPRVWEKIQEKMVAVGRQSSGAKKKIALWAKGVGLRYSRGQQATGDGSIPWGYTLAKKLVFNKVRAKLGLEECVFCATGAAPMKGETFDFFASLGIVIQNLYGMSESCLGATNRQDYFIIGSNGPCPLGGEIKLEHVEGRDKPGQGEICMRGRGTMMGYMYNEAKTKAAIDDEGWLHSGDVGEWRNNCLYITGRIKELIIGAGGENIAPVPIENYIKSIRPALSNFIMIGDQRKYNTALVTLKTEGSPQGGYGGNPALVNEAADVDTSVKTVAGAQKSEKWKAYIQEGIDKYNSNAERCVSRAQRIQKFIILDEDLSIPQGTLGPTLKVKRPIVNNTFVKEIESLY